MSVTPTKVLGWSGIQGLLAAIVIFLVGTPAGFSICGFTWKLPWDPETNAKPREEKPAPALAPAPVFKRPPLAVQRVWSSPLSVVFCVSVKNDQNRSMTFRSGHLNLSEVGLADSDWTSVALPPWDAVRLQAANVQIVADRESPGTLHGFRLDLTVPPGHERKFLLQIDAVNVPVGQQNRFFVVGSLVLEEGTAELATPDIDLFGRRLAQGGRHMGVSPVSPVVTRTEPLSPLRREPRTGSAMAQRPPANEARPPEPASSVERLTHQLGKFKSYATDFRNKLPLPFSSTTSNTAPLSSAAPGAASPDRSTTPPFASQRTMPGK